MIERSAIARSKEGFAARKVGGELVLVPMRDSVAEMEEMFTLNEVGSVIWEHLAPGTTEKTLLDAIVAEFDIDRDTATADLREFVSALAAHLRL